MAVKLAETGRGSLETLTTTFSPDNLNDWQGDNDIGMGANPTGGSTRVPVVKMGGVTTSGTTLTFTSGTITGIRPMQALHIMDQNGGTGVLGSTIILVEQIIDSTTLILSSPPQVDLSGVEIVMFHMHVNDEYHLVGILSPIQYIGESSTTNRTLYLPQSMQAIAYHEDGTDAFVEVEVYADPIVSGNDMTLPIDAASGLAANVELGAPLKIIEPNNPFTGVVSYANNGSQAGRLNYFGEGFHVLATYIKGSSGKQELSSQFNNYQSGAFKLPADGGGNNRCPILRVYQSHESNMPTTVQINTPPTGVNFSRHREGNALTFENIPGLIGTDPTYGINGKTFYVRMISLDTLELYLDKEFTQPFDSSGLSNSSNSNSYTWPGSSGFIISGYGSYLYFAVVAKAVGPSATYNWYKPVGDGGKGPITVHYVLTWNEILQ
jgi:hypothetical protein